MTPFEFGRVIGVKLASHQKRSADYHTGNRRMSSNVEVAPEPPAPLSKNYFSQFVDAQADARELQLMNTLRSRMPDYSPQHLKPYGPNSDRMALDAAWREEHRFAPETPGSQLEVETFNGTGDAFKKEMQPLVHNYYTPAGTSRTQVDKADLQRQLAALNNQPSAPVRPSVSAPKPPAPMSAPKPPMPAAPPSAPKIQAPKAPTTQPKSVL